MELEKLFKMDGFFFTKFIQFICSNINKCSIKMYYFTGESSREDFSFFFFLEGGKQICCDNFMLGYYNVTLPLILVQQRNASYNTGRYTTFPIIACQINPNFDIFITARGISFIWNSVPFIVIISNILSFWVMKKHILN